MSRESNNQPEASSNTFQSGGGTQSVAQGDKPIGTQINNYYAPPLQAAKPQPRSAVRMIIIVCAFIGAALLAATYYSGHSDKQTKTVTQAKPAAQAVPPAAVEPVKLIIAETASKTTAKTEPSTVVVDAMYRGNYEPISK